jgi:hypothetical protein
VQVSKALLSVQGHPAFSLHNAREDVKVGGNALQCSPVEDADG